MNGGAHHTDGAQRNRRGQWRRPYRGQTRIPWLHLLGLWLAFPLAVPAAPNHLEVTPFAGYQIGGGFRDRDSSVKVDVASGAAYGAVLNFSAERNTQWEAFYSHQSSNLIVPGVSSPGRLNIDYLQLGGSYLFEAPQSQPFIAAGIGMARLDVRGGPGRAETDFAFSMAGGLKWLPTRRIGLRLEGRVLGAVTGGDSAVFCASGPGGSGCLLRSRAEVFWQWQMLAGAIFRF